MGMIMKRKGVLGTVIALGLMMRMTLAGAGEIDVLVQKLVDKKILTPIEARTILDETRIEVREDLVKGESYATPEWTQRLTLKGDLRTRYQYSDTENTNAGANDVRHRARLRLRLGTEAKVNDKVKVGFGFASGDTADSRSTNQTLSGDFGKKALWIDYAFAQYTPFDWADIVAGKFKNPIWNPSDLLWDTDINPEGAAVLLHYDVNSNVKAFMNTAFFLMEESGNNNDEPTMWAFQPGFEILHGNTSWKNAFTLYAVNDAKGIDRTWDAGSNEYGNYNYSAGALSTELAFRFPEAPIKYAALYGDAVYNPDGNEPGYLGGLKLGDEKVGTKFGDWQARGLYRYLETNAFLDSYPDSDAYGGRTDVKGPEFGLDLGLGKNVVLGIDYYHLERISLNDTDTEKLLQMDINYKF